MGIGCGWNRRHRRRRGARGRAVVARGSTRRSARRHCRARCCRCGAHFLRRSLPWRGRRRRATHDGDTLLCSVGGGVGGGTPRRAVAGQWGEWLRRGGGTARRAGRDGHENTGCHPNIRLAAIATAEAVAARAADRRPSEVYGGRSAQLVARHPVTVVPPSPPLSRRLSRRRRWQVAHAFAPPQASRRRQARRRCSPAHPPPPPHQRHAVHHEGPQGRSAPPPALPDLGRDQHLREVARQDALSPDHRWAPRPAAPSSLRGACRPPSRGRRAPAHVGRGQPPRARPTRRLLAGGEGCVPPPFPPPSPCPPTCHSGGCGRRSSADALRHRPLIPASHTFQTTLWFWPSCIDRH